MSLQTYIEGFDTENEWEKLRLLSLEKGRVSESGSLRLRVPHRYPRRESSRGWNSGGRIYIFKLRSEKFWIRSGGAGGAHSAGEHELVK